MASSSCAQQYLPADGHGYFVPQSEEEDSSGLLYAPKFAFDEQERDPSERRPGGPVAEVVRAMLPQVSRLKWFLPAVAFLLASLLQTVCIYTATQRYVLWMDRLQTQLLPGGEASLKLLRSNETGLHSLLKPGYTLPTESFRLHDNYMNYAVWPDLRITWPVTIDFDILVSGALPIVWALVAMQSRDLRLWARTLIAATFLALLRAFLSWATVMPDAAGWDGCQERLRPGVVEHFRSMKSADGSSSLYVAGGALLSSGHVFWLWLVGTFFGKHGRSGLTCGDCGLGPSCLNAVCALGLYDAVRTHTSKHKPGFRSLYRLLAALLLSAVAVGDCLADVTAQRQYSAPAVLALVFALLVYGSPAVAVAADHWMTHGSADLAALREEPWSDEGDVVVPPCCLPFCFFHGRYYLFSMSGVSAEATLRERERQDHRSERQYKDQDEKLAEEFRAEEEEAARRSAELEALITDERRRSKERERDEAVRAQTRLEEAVAARRRKFEAQATKLALEAQADFERAAASQWEEKAAGELRRLSALEAHLEEERARLGREADAAQGHAMAESVRLAACESEAAVRLSGVDELRRSVSELGGALHAQDAAAAALASGAAR